MRIARRRRPERGAQEPGIEKEEGDHGDLPIEHVVGQREAGEGGGSHQRGKGRRRTARSRDPSHHGHGRRDEHQQEREEAADAGLGEGRQVLAVRLPVDDVLGARDRAGRTLALELVVEVSEADSGERRMQAGPQGRLPEREALPDQVAPAPTISGACFCMRREDFDFVGGFDEGYFLHVEDVDLCWRVREAGGQVLFHPGAEVIHIGGTSQSSPLKVEFHKGVGLARYFRKRAGTRRGAKVAAWLLGPLVVGAAVIRPLMWRLRKNTD